DGWQSMKPIGPRMFIYLMRLPDEVPPFAYTRNHVIWDYYIWTKEGKYVRICSDCFGSKGQFYKAYSANLWLESGWSFKRIQDHCIYDGESLMQDLIWDLGNWCK